MIRASGLTVAYEDVVALEGVDLEVAAGEFVTIVGPSGCGKTTLLRAIAGLEEPTRGAVLIDGREPAAARAAGNLGFVFQRHTLFPWKTALQNVTFLRTVAGKPAETDRAADLLERVGLGGAEHRYPEELSGGMAQRVAIARALHLGADLLLMDEPFGELDEITREELGVELRELWRRERKTVLFVTHSVPEAVLLADRCLLVDGPPGRLTASFEVDLPRPRDESVFESRAFQRQVAAVRSSLHGARAERTRQRDP
ncbi:ABC transporter ATP-binding protein [Natrononativus amylolyticus]|uniref:ABC transporter ATP-binding protein n=1 Tax=Natrononativus amylolyticus TaxID=2963434 RepID=UPI0020CFDB61|nr:ABC transporter ATP-binding protein [Natrononativus amylolyticus]